MQSLKFSQITPWHYWYQQTDVVLVTATADDNDRTTRPNAERHGGRSGHGAGLSAMRL